jgi:hypothetical protein
MRDIGRLFLDVPDVSLGQSRPPRDLRVGKPELSAALGQSTAELARILRALHIESMRPRGAAPSEENRTGQRAEGP